MNEPDAETAIGSEMDRRGTALAGRQAESPAIEQHTTYRLGYRGDIEGLRAVAILLVIACHARVPGLGGGYVGVDVFFVLSGYLITALLVRDIAIAGQVRFANFYARRFRRLLPALLLMLVCASVLGAIVLAPGGQGTQATAAASAALWSSNLHFAFSTLDYFGPAAGSNLFLHTWSLGVEEQFYLLWPLLLALLAGVWRARVRFSIGRLKIAMLVIAAISLGLCVYWTDVSQPLAFYMMPARAWQFALGALTLLYFPQITGRGPEPERATSAGVGMGPLARWMGWTGIAMILAASVVFDAETAYPGVRALLPSLGAAGVLAAGAVASRAGVSRLLSWRPMQAIGHVSYSWYLWHWPVLLLGAALFTPDTAADRAFLIVLSFLLAVLSYRLVESPIRRNATLISRPGIMIFGALAIMVIANAGALYWYAAAGRWANLPLQRRYQDAHLDAPIIYLKSMNCGDWVLNTEVHVCAFGPPHAAHTAVLMGDSLAGQWFPAVARVFDKPGWRLFVLTKSACPMVDFPIFYARIGREYTECAIWRARALNYVALVKPDVVILSSFPTTAFDRQHWASGTTDVLKVFDGETRHVFLLRATPRLPFDGPDCLAERQWRPAFLVPHDGCVASAFSRQNADVYAWLSQVADRFHNVSMIDMNELICPGGICAAERQGRIVFRDNQHLTASFARSLGDAMAKKMDAPRSAPRGGTGT
ncbi:MAG TPA: acyltransferase family protein [Rhodanobacteraceae bacterium]|nr:acyltransferase family protein [Rhodanobacteraceae bacterium]